LFPVSPRRVAGVLGIPFFQPLMQTKPRQEQKLMMNSAMQAANIYDTLAFTGGVLPPGPVLLVDDVVDSCWTMTIAAWLLRKHGTESVLPLALALTGNED